MHGPPARFERPLPSKLEIEMSEVLKIVDAVPNVAGPAVAWYGGSGRAVRACRRATACCQCAVSVPRCATFVPERQTAGRWPKLVDFCSNWPELTALMAQIRAGTRCALEGQVA